MVARGRNNKIVGQTGEYLVAAELSRRGLICTTFTGNVPHYDLIASNESGMHLSVQVKASMRGSWHFSHVTDFCEIEFLGDRQIVKDKKPCPIRGLVVVFVKVDTDRNDEFYLLTWDDLRALITENHTAYLAKHRGVRPKNPGSLHVSVRSEQLLPYRDNWAIVEKVLEVKDNKDSSFRAQPMP